MTDDPLHHRAEAEEALQRPGYQVRITQAWESRPRQHELVGAVAADEFVSFVDALVAPVLERELGAAPPGGALLPMAVNEYFHVEGDGLDEPVALSLDEADQSMVGAVLGAIGVDLQVRAEVVEAAGRSVRLLHVEPTEDLPAMSQHLRDQAMRGLHQFMAGFGI